jgi:hypothetical protein
VDPSLYSFRTVEERMTMVLVWPLSLLGLLLTAAVAAWALFRPSRQLAVVGTLALWQKALDALDRSARRSSRRVNASWVLLLLGSAAAVVALARPVASTSGQGRVVSLTVWPSAELAGKIGRAELPRAAGALLGRLGPADRVELLLPTILGGSAGLVSPAEAIRRVEDLPILPVAASEMSMPEARGDSQHTYWLIPAGARPVPMGPRTTVIELATDLPAVDIQAAGAAECGMANKMPVPPPAGQVEVFIALRVASGAPWAGKVSIKSLPLGGDASPPLAARWREDTFDVAIPESGRKSVVRRIPPAAAIAVTVGLQPPSPLAAAYLARSAGARRKVALVGTDEPLLRRFIQADESLVLVASPREADLVIANAAPAPAGKPALVIDPPTDPPGWQRGAVLRDVGLAGAAVAADDPVMRRVRLESAAVRLVRPWVRVDKAATQVVLASLRDEAILLRDAPAGGGADASRTVYVAMALSTDNTNLSMSDAFVVLLANAVRWLAPAGQGPAAGAGEARYESLRPHQAPRDAGWVRLAGEVPDVLGPGVQPLLWPGVFRDPAGTLAAVSLRNLGGTSRPGRESALAAADAPLPAPRPLGREWELWPALAVLAMGLWLAGWAFRVK